MSRQVPLSVESCMRALGVLDDEILRAQCMHLSFGPARYPQSDWSARSASILFP